MPAYPWLAERVVNGQTLQKHMRALQRIGDPYTDDQIDAAAQEVAGKTEMEALIAYLQGLGTEWTGQRVAPRAGGDT
jgi:cytochrome c oxidase cbb3-type subunit 2